MKSLRARIAFFFVALLVLVMGLSALFVSRSNSQIARETIGQSLLQGERIFQRLLVQNQARLEQGAAILSSDFAFRQAIATNDTGTIASVLRNHGARAGASAMMLVSLTGTVRADSRNEAQVGRSFAFAHLLGRAAAEGRASAIVELDHRLYQLVVVPVNAPDAIAWVALAYEVDDRFAAELRQLTGLEVSFVSRRPNGSWQLHASTLGPALRQSLGDELSGETVERTGEVDIGGEVYETRVTRLGTEGDVSIAAVLQKSLFEALLPFQRIASVFLWLSAAALALLVMGSIAIARGITQPVQRLADAARRVQEGDYSHRVEVEQKDEIGSLAVSFNHMLDGIKSREKEILRLAYEDGLTGLPNRSMFGAELEQAVKNARRTKESIAVMLLDMDRFKTINDTLGHPVGDQVLREVGVRVRTALRESDIVARLGGDEFAVLLTTGVAERADTAAGKILKALEAPLVIEGQSMDIAASIGIARFPEHGDDSAALIRAADVAMYAAKRSKSGYTIYDPRDDLRRQEHLTLLGELRRAVEADQLVLHYQPKVSLAENKVTSVEALVRWSHPTRGFVPPGDFIPFAEQTGYIGAITKWVLTRAIDQCGQWHRGGMRVRVSVNISARDLRHDSELVRYIEEALGVAELPAALLCLEITESALMDDPGSAQSTLRRLRELGVAASIDDYGTGYSSLAYIKQLAVSELKIDRTFVSGMEADARNAAIVRSTIELGHNLGLSVVAEGVETDYELAELVRFGCDMAQGFHFARPMPADQLEAWMNARI
jgi:diguanylate cyclase (GGDEF)-like protein